ncbi:MAG: aminotransferase class I/II-fold pyridoxal phosphate-dependent enzyme [Thermodesulfobacteriota bacterium]|nr:aminotransferase class I/II-fold pyridoxal phosphate-dependent enzyme [Thermodesulfobacteriota bacterium]
MNQQAQELNSVIKEFNPHIYDMLSSMGKNLFFPKGILSQSAEAREKADKINATIGIAKENGKVMSLPSIAQSVNGIEPDDFLTYAPSFGVLELRKAWRNALYTKNPSLENKKITLPVVTSGVTHAVSTFADLWIDPGDTVILPDMMWGNYNMTFSVRNRAKISHYRTFIPDLSGLDLDSFEKAVKKEAAAGDKIITVLNFPHNPSGYSISKDEGKRIANILIDIAKNGTNVVVACDDAYFGLFYEDDTMKESLFSLLAGADKRIVAVKLDGATKEDYVWGLRTGFVTYGFCADRGVEELHEAVEKKTAGCIRGCVSNASHLSQSIILQSMNNKKYLEFKQEKFDLLKARAFAIKDIVYNETFREAWDVYPFNSGYFMCIRLKDVNAEDLRVHLLEKYGTGLISIGEENLRIAFSCLEKSDVKVLFDTILKGINELKLKIEN